MPVIEAIIRESEASPEMVMAALAKVAQGNEPLLLSEQDRPDVHAKPSFKDRPERSDRGGRNERSRSPSRSGRDGPSEGGRERKPSRPRSNPEAGMKRFRIEVGYTHGAKPGNIVGAIANEGDMSSKNIGAIDIHDSFTLVDLPDSMPEKTKETLMKTRVAGQRLNMREWSEEAPNKRPKN
jgi:ATP-dependent RNA helicase DeaD